MGLGGLREKFRRELALDGFSELSMIKTLLEAFGGGLDDSSRQELPHKRFNALDVTIIMST